MASARMTPAIQVCNNLGPPSIATCFVSRSGVPFCSWIPHTRGYSPRKSSLTYDGFNATGSKTVIAPRIVQDNGPVFRLLRLAGHKTCPARAQSRWNPGQIYKRPRWEPQSRTFRPIHDNPAFVGLDRLPVGIRGKFHSLDSRSQPRHLMLGQQMKGA